VVQQKAQKARKVSIRMGALSTEVKNRALSEIALGLKECQEDIFKANRADLARAEAEKIRPALVKRLKFDAEKLEIVLEGIESLIRLPDPVGMTQSCTELDTGLELYKVTCPIGVLGVVFESRPDALVQISTLALKSGNAVLLKGGSEAARTNKVLAEIINRASQKAGVPEGWLTLLETRDDVKQMLSLDEYIDLVVPRGSNEFVKYIMDNTRIPVLGHADGICHVFIDKAADPEKAFRVAYDAKCQYAAVCNAMETLLIHREIADQVLRQAATEQDWTTEYNDLILSIKIVSSLEEAIDHINYYGSHHTDAIVTENVNSAHIFMELVDSANVFWNCSTRFSDGYRYGLGAEIGISTNKIHARGPVGLEGLVTYKWKLMGNGHIVADYSGKNAKRFTHRKLKKKL